MMRRRGRISAETMIVTTRTRSSEPPSPSPTSTSRTIVRGSRPSNVRRPAVCPSLIRRLAFLLITRGLPELCPTPVSTAKRLTESKSDAIQHHMTDDSTSNPTWPKTRAPLLPPPAPISYRMVGRLYDEADCANTVKVDAVGEQHRVEAEDNVNAHSCRYWHRVGELFPSISVVLSLLVMAHPYTAAQLTSSFSWKWNEHLSPSLSLVAYLSYSRHFSPSSPLPHSCPCSSSLLFLGSLLYYNN